MNKVNIKFKRNYLLLAIGILVFGVICALCINVKSFASNEQANDDSGHTIYFKVYDENEEEKGGKFEQDEVFIPFNSVDQGQIEYLEVFSYGYKEAIEKFAAIVNETYHDGYVPHYYYMTLDKSYDFVSSYVCHKNEKFDDVYTFDQYDTPDSATVVVNVKKNVTNYTVSGTVSEAEANGPVAGASVVYQSNNPENYSVSTTTGADGTYSLTIAGEENILGTLSVKAEGYEATTNAITLESFAGETTLNLPITLSKIVPPEPQPQPKEEKASGTTQTGDYLAPIMISLAILALTSGAYVARKKLMK